MFYLLLLIHLIKNLLETPILRCQIKHSFSSYFKCQFTASIHNMDYSLMFIFTIDVCTLFWNTPNHEVSGCLCLNWLYIYNIIIVKIKKNYHRQNVLLSEDLSGMFSDLHLITYGSVCILLFV